MARNQPAELYELSNELLALMSRDVTPAAHDVHQERLTRDIMAVDNIEYDEARQKMAEMFYENRTQSWWNRLPNDAGLFISGAAAVIVVPIVFHADVGLAFADRVAASYDELPTTSSYADVGTWGWAWCEPMIGTASFSILCLQLLRERMLALGVKPFSDFVLSRRAQILAEKYPQYSPAIVKAFSRSQPMRGRLSKAPYIYSPERGGLTQDLEGKL